MSNENEVVQLNMTVDEAKILIAMYAVARETLAKDDGEISFWRAVYTTSALSADGSKTEDNIKSLSDKFRRIFGVHVAKFTPEKVNEMITKQENKENDA